MAIKLDFLRRLLTMHEQDDWLALSKNDKLLLPNGLVGGSRETKNASQDLVGGR